MMSIEQPPGQTGCAVIPKRWVVERSIAWAGRNRLEVGAANNYSPQPQPRIKRSLSLSRFYRNAPESALSEMLVFDHALSITEYLFKVHNFGLREKYAEMMVFRLHQGLMVYYFHTN